jgi:hypothetical protein
MIRRALLIAALLAGATRAWAASPDDEARARAFSATGVRQYNEGLYDQAIASFEAAYKLVPLPLLVFDIAQSYRLKGEAYCAESLDHYRAFLRAASPRDANRSLAEEFVAQMEACVRRRASPPPLAPPSDTGTSAPVLTQPVPPERPPSRLALRISGIAGIALGVGLVGGGAAFASAAAHEQSEIDDACRGGCMWTDDLAATERSRGNDTTKGIALLTVGGVALIAGATLTYFGWRPMPRRR